MREDQIKHMVNRFLRWPLPDPWHPDNGVSVVRPNYSPDVPWELTGTNLFDAQQAENMIRHLINGLPLASPSAVPATGDVVGVPAAWRVLTPDGMPFAVFDSQHKARQCAREYGADAKTQPLYATPEQALAATPTPAPSTPKDERICRICDGGPGNDGPCLCGRKAWKTPGMTPDVVEAATAGLRFYISGSKVSIEFADWESADAAYRKMVSVACAARQSPAPVQSGADAEPVAGDDCLMTPTKKPFQCSGFAAYVRSSAFTMDDAEMIAKKFDDADAEIKRLRDTHPPQPRASDRALRALVAEKREFAERHKAACIRDNVVQMPRAYAFWSGVLVTLDSVDTALAGGTPG